MRKRSSFDELESVQFWRVFTKHYSLLDFRREKRQWQEFANMFASYVIFLCKLRDTLAFSAFQSTEPVIRLGKECDHCCRILFPCCSLYLRIDNELHCHTTPLQCYRDFNQCIIALYFIVIVKTKACRLEPDPETSTGHFDLLHTSLHEFPVRSIHVPLCYPSYGAFDFNSCNSISCLIPQSLLDTRAFPHLFYCLSTTNQLDSTPEGVKLSSFGSNPSNYGLQYPAVAEVFHLNRGINSALQNE